MKVIAISTSIVTLLYLSYAFISETSDIQLAEKDVAELRSVSPILISETRLEAENTWQKLKDQKNKPKIPPVKKKEKAVVNKDIFSIADKRYVLYGIFNAGITNGTKKSEHTKQDSRAFILIKSYDNDNEKQKNTSKSELLKVVQGEELSPGIKLVALSTDSISFKHEDNIIKFKLFETKK